MTRNNDVVDMDISDGAIEARKPIQKDDQSNDQISPEVPLKRRLRSSLKFNNNTIEEEE